ncbi:uncharacterized protein LOC119739873 [Patiria miniata]|uniref:Uncharacterized protein n=1 Tax=Patiria miniata TaxID=46514 RepID=A0A914B530_PATMI|nr:uncharacterized protein LOC119739873 [Patiria miniata]
MRLFPIIAIFLWASVIETVSSQTLSTILGPSQGSPSTSTLTPEDCLSTINLQDIVFLSAVPIAAGFGLLLLLAFLQDFRQARKSNRSCPPSPFNIQGNRARKERIYVIDIDYAGRSRWDSFLRWFAMHKSPGANKNPHLVRLQGTFGFSDWLSFDLILGKNSEQKTLTTPRSIGKLVAVETKYPSASDGFTSRLLPSSNIGACLRGIVNRACDIEIKKIHAMDTKTQDHYTSGCGSSSGGISSSDQGITTILPLLLSTAQPVSRVNYIAYFFKNGSLWTSAFTPWRKGNFTGCRHITCLFACISYTMIAAQVVPKLSLDQSMEDAVLISLTDVNITAAMLVRAIVVGTVVFALLGFMETIFRGAPTIWSLHLPCVPPRPRNGNRFMDGLQPTCNQSAAGDFYGGSAECVEEGLPRISISAPAMQQQGCRPNGNDTQQTNTGSSCFDKIGKQCAAASDTDRQMNQVGNNSKGGIDKDHHAGLTRYSRWTVINGHGIYKLTVRNKSPIKVSTDSNADANSSSSISADTKAKHSFDGTNSGKCNIKPVPAPSSHVAITASDDIFGDNRSICAQDQLECQHKLTCYKCPVCHRTTGSRYYDPGASCSGNNTPTSLDSEDSSSSSSINNSTMGNICKSSTSDSGSYINRNESSSISDLTYINSGQPLDESASYNIQGAIETVSDDDDFIKRATSTSGLQDKKHKTTCKWEAGDRSQPVKHFDEGKMKQDINAQERFIKYSDALLDPDIKTAKVMRTKNYINRFSDMGKGKVVNLPYDVFLSEDKLATKKATDDVKPNLSTDGTKSSEVETGTITQTPCGPVTTGSDYIVNLPLEFEMPSVTIQRSRSNKPFFFSFRKWLSGLRSKPKVAIGDNYKLEVREDDAAMKTSDENICLPCSHDVTLEISTIQIEEEAKYDIISRDFYPGTANNLPNIRNNDNIDAKIIDDHLKRSIFLSSSRLIDYQPDVMSVTSSGSWNSITSSHSASDRRPVTPWKDVNATNKNNNSNETTTINLDIPSLSSMPCSTSSDEYLSLDSNKTSSSSVTPKSTSSEGICSSKDISSSNGTQSSKEAYSSKDTDGKEEIPISTDTYCIKSISSSKASRSSHDSCSNSICSSSDSNIDDEDNPRWNRYKYYQAMYEAEPTATPNENRLSDNFQPVMFLILHILLIVTCVFAVLWSVSSFHGLCWNVFWEWVATSIIAILIHAVILDTIKAALMTFIKWYYYYDEAKPKPYSVIQ